MAVRLNERRDPGDDEGHANERERTAVAGVAARFQRDALFDYERSGGA
jgi:hypothetical protein